MSIEVSCAGMAAAWSGRTIFSGIEFAVDLTARSSCLPIVGRTGLGKSTLLYLLSGMARPEAGLVSWRLPRLSRQRTAEMAEVNWSGESNRSFEPARRLRVRDFGFLFQDAAMIPCFTVEENLRHSMSLRGIPIGRKDAGRHIRAIVGAMTIAGESVERLLAMYPGRLSGGQRQRMALAAATAHNPSVLFADEPTASLDHETGIQVLRAVRSWLDAPDRASDRAFVFVTHNVEIIRPSLGASLALRLSSDMERSPSDSLRMTWETLH